MLAARHDFSKTDRPGSSRRLRVPKPSLRRTGDERASALGSSILPHARPTDSDIRAASYALGRDPCRPRIHTGLFVYRTYGLTPEIYASVRDPDKVDILTEVQNVRGSLDRRVLYRSAPNRNAQANDSLLATANRKCNIGRN